MFYILYLVTNTYINLRHELSKETYDITKGKHRAIAWSHQREKARSKASEQETKRNNDKEAGVEEDEKREMATAN